MPLVQPPPRQPPMGRHQQHQGGDGLAPGGDGGNDRHGDHRCKHDHRHLPPDQRQFRRNGVLDGTGGCSQWIARHAYPQCGRTGRPGAGLPIVQYRVDPSIRKRPSQPLHRTDTAFRPAGQPAVLAVCERRSFFIALDLADPPPAAGNYAGRRGAYAWPSAICGLRRRRNELASPVRRYRENAPIMVKSILIGDLRRTICILNTEYIDLI